MKKLTFRRLCRVVSNYLVFFLLVAFVVTCCMTLFLNILANSMGITFTDENIAAAAKATFLNVVLITFLFGVADYIRRKILVDRPVKKITQAAEKITQGDFSVRIQMLPDVAANDGFNEIIRAINQMARELSGTETLRSDFIANVSHELKTPLAVMGNYAALLQQPGLSREEQQEYAGAISESSQRLAQLITNILKLNKLENQQIYPKNEEFDLGEQLCGCLLQFEDLWERKNIQIEADIQQDVRIRSDPELLEHVWNNLMSNALKFTPEGGTVRVCLETEGPWITVSVSDTGCGMTPEVGAHIFEKFYQGDTSHATQGNGLGLPLVKRVVDILNGQITVRSRLHQGSTFTVKFMR